MSHRGSILCLPDGIWAWPVDAPHEITAESLARVFAAKGVELFMLGTGKQPWLMPEALRWRFRDARIGLEVTPTGRGGAHLQHPVRRRPPRRRRADRGGLSSLLPRAMDANYRHCEELVRAADKDRYLATLFAPADRRGPLFALYAFNAEIASVRDRAREPMAGEIRLQWWRDVLNGERGGEAAANPVAAALHRHDRAVRVAAPQPPARSDRGACVRPLRRSDADA